MSLCARYRRSLAGALVVAAVAAADARPDPCRSAQFTLAGKPIGAAGATSPTAEVGALVGLGDLCPLVAPAKRAARVTGVTEVRARWEGCPGLIGPVRAKLRVTRDCTQLTGWVRAKGYRRNVTGVRTDCG